MEDTQRLAYLCAPDSTGIPHDPFHRTMPVLTKFEIAAILKWRVGQLQYDPMTYLRGADGEYMMLPHLSPYLIAQEELRRKVLPLLIKRPFHHGHSHEVWRLQDLLLLQPLEIDTKQLSFEPKDSMTPAERLQSLVV
jgi:DNA-directed RNA polymerase subunit K/omega